MTLWLLCLVNLLLWAGLPDKINQGMFLDVYLSLRFIFNVLRNILVYLS